MDREYDLRRLVSGGGVRMNKDDSAQWDALEAARNREFRALAFTDYIRDVDAAGALVDKYRPPAGK